MSKKENPDTDKNFMITNNNAVDVHVGQRIRRRRTLLGMSQEQLGAELNVTFQQVQKYERGSNRVSASRLWDISQILDVDISFFFDEMSNETKAQSPRRVSKGGGEADAGPKVRDPMARRETLELVRNYYSIEDAHTRKKVAELLKSITATIHGK